MDSDHRPVRETGDHAESTKAYRDPTTSRRIHLPARVRLRRASDLLDLAASRHLGLEQVAALFEVSPDHLLKLFRKSGFPSPMRQVRRLELQKAAERLREDHVSAETVAEECGYADSSSLRRALRRAFGQRLRELRRGTKAESL